MSYTLITLVLFALTAFGYLMGRRQGAGFRSADHVHSLPDYHGAYVALIALLPAALVFLLWVAIEPMVADSVLRSQLRSTLGLTEDSALNLAISQVKGLAGGASAAAAAVTSGARAAATVATGVTGATGRTSGGVRPPSRRPTEPHRSRASR